MFIDMTAMRENLWKAVETKYCTHLCIVTNCFHLIRVLRILYAYNWCEWMSELIGKWMREKVSERINFGHFVANVCYSTQCLTKDNGKPVCQFQMEKKKYPPTQHNVESGLVVFRYFQLFHIIKLLHKCNVRF